MPQFTRCPHCSKPLQVLDEALGKHVRCPACQRHFLVHAAPARQPAAAAVPVGQPAGAAAASRPATSRGRGTKPLCPACKSPVVPGGMACGECGYLLQDEPDINDLE